MIKRNKFGARKTPYNGVIYDSGAEAALAMELDLRMKAGEFTAVFRQIPFSLDVRGHDGKLYHIGSVKLDFSAQLSDGKFRYIEYKGRASRDWPLRRKLVEALYGIKVEVVTKTTPLA